MSYQVTARKWRPQSFDQIVFQDHVSKTLRNSIAGGRISHAYIFSGPRGVGKTTMARVLAKALNCLASTGPTPEPCGKCDNCREIREGVSFDVIEIDGASNRGIDDVRELRENVNFAPLKSRFKVYIIDEVHMLTKEAFNALLKTLEEPPPHVVFVFATTEIHQIPETILSRCQKFFFKKIPIAAIVAHLKLIVSREGYRISEKALYPVARAAEGSMRDAQSLLDQLISFSNQKGGDAGAEFEIDEDDALSILGIVSLDSHMRLLDCILSGNAADAMAEVEKLSSMGADIARYVAGFIDMLRIIRLIRNRAEVGDMFGFSGEERGRLEDFAASFEDDELSSLFGCSVSLQSELRYSSNERINLEMALLDMIAMKKNPSIAAIIKKLESGPEKKNDPVSGTQPARSRPESAAPERKPAVKEPHPVPESPRAPFKQVWTDFLRSIQHEQQYLFSILKSASTDLSDGVLSISFAGEDAGIYYRMLDSKRMSFIKESVSPLLGRDIKIVHGRSPAPEGADEQPQGSPSASRPMANAPDDEVIPPPDAEMVAGAELPDTDRKESHAVDRIKDAFLGEIIDKGDRNAKGTG